MGLLSTLISSFFVSDGISFLHVAKIVELSFKHGASTETPYGLAWYGVFAASLYEAYDEGRAFAEAAIALINHRELESGRIAALLALDQVAVWTRPLDYSLAPAGAPQCARALPARPRCRPASGCGSMAASRPSIWATGRGPSSI
jgi:hypothetical protein